MIRMLLYKIPILVIIIYFLTNCQNTEDGIDMADRYGGKINIGLLGNIDNLFPYSLKEYYAQEISQYLLNTSLTITGYNDIALPELAAGWHIDKDKRSITYLLNNDFRWSNGRKFSGQDVLATYRFLSKYNERVNPAHKIRYIKDVQLIDSMIIRFTFDQEVIDPFRWTRFPILSFEQIDWDKDFNTIVQEFTTKNIGCGTFVLSAKTEQKVVLKKNSFYPKIFPYLDQITFRFYQNHDSLINALTRNQLHFVYSMPVTAINKINNLPDYSIKTGLERGFTFLGWNLHNPLLKSRNVRKALTCALDRVTMADGILSGYAQVGDAPSYPGFWAYYNIQPVKYDPHRALQLLENEGWNERTEDGFLKKGGQTFFLNIITNQENRIRRELAINIRAYYHAIGIDIRLDILPWVQLLERLERGKFDGVIISWVENGPYNLAELFHSSSIEQGNNFMAYSNVHVDQLLEDAINAADRKKRKESWQEFQKQIIFDQPVTVLFYKKIINVVSNRLQNVRIDDSGFLKNAKEWYIKERK